MKPGSSRLRGIYWLALTSRGSASSVLQDRCHYPALCHSDKRQRGPFFLPCGSHFPDITGHSLTVSLSAGHNPFSYFLPHRSAVMCSGRESLCGFPCDTSWVLLLREVDLDADGVWK